MNFLIDFSFIVSGVMNHQHMIPHYITNWNDASISNLDLSVDWINNDILKPNGCVFVTESSGDEYTIGSIELQNFAIVQSPSNTDNIEQLEITQITKKNQFEGQLLGWLESLDNIKCFRKENGRRLLFTSEQANELIHTMNINTKHNKTPQKDIDSYSLRQINELRKAEGMDSWQTELAKNSEPFGIDSVKFNSRLVTYLPKFGTPTMTKYSNVRRLMNDKTNDNTDSYLSHISLSSFGGAVIFLPWWVSITMAIIALICVICTVVCIKRLNKRMQSKSPTYALMPMPMSPLSPVSIEVIVI